MEKVRREARGVAGMTVRTSNSDEMQPDKARIGGLWQAFSRQLAERSITPAAVYGIYSNFESDERGAYDITVAMAEDDTRPYADRLTIPAGWYLRFAKEGPQPETTIGLWQEIWRYFAVAGAPRRTFVCDYEEYSQRDNVAIYVGIEEGL